MHEIVPNQLYEVIQKSLKPSRWQHTLRCQACAVRLANHYGYPEERVALAALCHDALRDLSATQWLRLAEKWQLSVLDQENKAPVLLHGPLAAKYFEFFWGFEDPEILSAIRFHTSGSPVLGPIGQIVFLADGIEPGRNYLERQNLERIAYVNLEAACLEMLKVNIHFLQKQNLVCHPLSEQWLKILEQQRKNGVSFES